MTSGTGGEPASRTLVYLARHGLTALNESGELRGLLDPPLDDTGQQQARRLGIVLCSRGPSVVIASPLLRAVQTARPTAECADLPVMTDQCLLDRDYGPWAGHPRESVIRQWGSIDAAPGVEPRDAVRDRAVGGLTSIARRYRGKTAVVVSHDAVNTEILAALDPGLGAPETIPQDNGCYNTLEWRDDQWLVLQVNQLPPEP